MESVWGDKAHKRERVHPCNVCDKAFKSLPTPNQHTIWQHSGHVFVCKGCSKKFKTSNSINRHKKLFGCKPHHRKSFCNFSMWGKGRIEEEDGSGQLQEEGRPEFLKAATVRSRNNFQVLRKIWVFEPKIT